VDVQPALTLQDGTPLPVITSVPVAFPRSGEIAITWPLAEGDTVWLWFAERSIDSWLDQGGQRPPDNPRRFDMSDAVAYPGVSPRPESVSNASPDHMVIGRQDGKAVIRIKDDVVEVEADVEIKLGDGAVSFVALANEVNTNLGLLSTLLTSWTVVPLDGGLALKTAALALVGTGWPVNVRATKVKAE
jgi:hypothetical protein